VTATAPGHDEIVLAAPEGRCLCHDRRHRSLGKLADVIVTFGQLGVPGTPRDACWPECWGRSYPMCGQCWDSVLLVVRKARPGLVVTGPGDVAPAGGAPQAGTGALGQGPGSCQG